MSRWVGLAKDPTSGGTRYDDQIAGGKVAIATPTIFVPATAAQVDMGITPHDRNNEVRGRRGNVAPVAFSASPVLTLECRAYPDLVNALLGRALGGTPAPTGTAPAAITSAIEPIQEGVLPALHGWLQREEQLDLLTGLVVASVELNFPVDAEGTIKADLHGLFSETATGYKESEKPKDPSGKELKWPTVDYSASVDTFSLRDLKAKRGSGEGTALTNVTGFKLTFDNGLITDPRVRFRAGANVLKGEVEGKKYKLWFPDRNKVGPQLVTGSIDFNSVDRAAEARRQLSVAEQLTIECFGGVLATTPASEQALKLTLFEHVLTGGGADPLAREGEQMASFEFSAYLDPTGTKDVLMEAVAKAAVAF